MAESDGLTRLNEEELDNLAGGYLYQPPGTVKLQVIDWCGNVMGTFFTKDEAYKFAWEHGVSLDKISDEYLRELRAANS